VLLSIRDTREPTADEREQLETLAVAAGYEPERSPSSRQLATSRSSYRSEAHPVGGGYW